MMPLLVIALGGALGAVTRFLVAQYVNQLLGATFPYGTLVVNISGSFLMGFLAVLFLEILPPLSMLWRAALLVGFLGGFTTFSAFSWETVDLLLQGDSFKAVSNIFLSVGLCLCATWLGVILARHL